MLLALRAELVTVVTVALLAEARSLTEDQSFAIFTWAMAGLGLGLIGSFVHATCTAETDELAPYRDAQRLSGSCSTSPTTSAPGSTSSRSAGAVLGDVGDAIPTVGLALLRASRRGAGARSRPGATTRSTPSERPRTLAGESWAQRRAVVRDHAFAFPRRRRRRCWRRRLRTGRRTRHRRGRAHHRPAARRAAGQVGPARHRAAVLRLPRLGLGRRPQAAGPRDARRRRPGHRLARLPRRRPGRAAGDRQAGQAARDAARADHRDRRRGAAVGAELRTSIGEAQSLGTAIGTVARHLSESSRIPIQVTLDEQATRLRPEVEAELFRITQEAMNNAVKHAQCSSIEVHCQVDAPDVADHGLRRRPRPAAGPQRLARPQDHARAGTPRRAPSSRSTTNPTGGLGVAVRSDLAARPRRSPDIHNAERVAP